MSEENERVYTAIITISLPDVAESVTAHVVLSPADTVLVDSRTKRLRDCTLADLQAFADLLEAEVWETFQAIKLVELASDKQVQVEVTPVNQSGEPQSPLEEWPDQVVILPEAEATAAPATPEDETVAGAGTAATDGDAEAGGREDATIHPPPPEVETAETPADKAEPATEPPSPVTTEPEPGRDILHVRVTVSEGKPVRPEREARPGKRIDTAVTDAAIAPSLARVRIAGKRRPLGHPTWTAVDILMDEPALRAAQAHALSSPDREVAGVLIGEQPEKQPDGRYLVHVFDAIIAKYTVMHGASVTYTPESWRYMNDKLAERYPDGTAVMVGWYHTHPGFGVFLSGMDKFIHQNFFTQIWHVALVLDPLAHKSGFFCWDRHKTRVNRYEFPWPGWAASSW